MVPAWNRSCSTHAVSGLNAQILQQFSRTNNEQSRRPSVQFFNIDGLDHTKFKPADPNATYLTSSHVFKALQAMAPKVGKTSTVTSVARSELTQVVLHRLFHASSHCHDEGYILAVADPSAQKPSAHNGVNLAWDGVCDSTCKKAALAVGFRQPYANDPVHYELVPPAAFNNQQDTLQAFKCLWNKSMRDDKERWLKENEPLSTTGGRVLAAMRLAPGAGFPLSDADLSQPCSNF